MAFAVAVIVAFQLSLAHWLPSYIVWFAPLFLVTLVGATDPERSGDEEPSRPASDRQAEQDRADPDDRPVSPGALAEHG